MLTALAPPNLAPIIPATPGIYAPISQHSYDIDRIRWYDGMKITIGKDSLATFSNG